MMGVNRENGNKYGGMEQKSLRRATGIIGMAPDVDPSTWDHSEIERYGLGTARPLSLFYKLFLIDPLKRQSVQLCPQVRSGWMHRDFQPKLRSDGLGIDYSKLEDYDFRTELLKHAQPQRADAEGKLTQAINTKSIGGLRDGIAACERVGLIEASSSLLRDGKLLLTELTKNS